ncbi:MAG: riboflavin biosynthesis protein RibF [Clostridia bacterium]|nr:riboflavin biosynthesis protein RibF [Clostridia bacterium]
MLRVIDSNSNSHIDNGMVIGVGFFDCLHLGHRLILDMVKRKASALDCAVALTTFDNNFHSVLGRDDKLIYTFTERCRLFEQNGVQVVIADKFDEQLACLTSKQYFDRLVALGAKCIVCGQDYTFGIDKGDVNTLSRYCANADIDMICVDYAQYQDIRVSATRIRNALLDNDVQLANALLVQPYFIHGQVIHGRGVGTGLGFPTANMCVDSSKLLPIGVFGGYCVIENTTYPVMLNIGSIPTFGIDNASIEAYIDGYNGNLYDNELTVFITKFIRNIIKFDTKQQLILQLIQDYEVIHNG